MRVVVPFIAVVALLAGCSPQRAGQQADDPTDNAQAPPEWGSVAPTDWEDVPQTTEVKLDTNGGNTTVPVLINDAIKLNFTIDSGASDVQVPADVVITMLRSGTLDQSDIIGQRTYRMADGSTTSLVAFRIRSLRVGDLVVHNITATITNSNGFLLLGQSFLSRVSSWSIDNQRGVLVLGVEKPESEAVASAVITTEQAANAANANNANNTTNAANPSTNTTEQDGNTPDPSSNAGNASNQPASTSTDTPPDTPSNTPPVTGTGDLKDRMKSYLAADAQNNIELLRPQYADHINFYGQMRSRDFVMQAKARYVGRWPNRSYQLRDPSFTVSCSAHDGTCVATGIIDWTAANQDAGRRSAGVSQVVLCFSHTLIVCEGGRVLARH